MHHLSNKLQVVTMRMDRIYFFLVRIHDYVIVKVNSLLVIVYGYSLIGTMETLK